MWRAKARNGVSVVWETRSPMDLKARGDRLDLPVYFFEGIYDYTCAYPLAKEISKNRVRP